jgi:hypothetical protein
MQRDVDAFLDWDAFSRADAGLFLWEAFVSGAGKGSDHIGDAALAVAAFSRSLPHPEAANIVECKDPVYSLAGAALLRTGWSTDLGVLEQSCLTIGTGVRRA